MRGNDELGCIKIKLTSHLMKTLERLREISRQKGGYNICNTPDWHIIYEKKSTNQ